MPQEIQFFVNGESHTVAPDNAPTLLHVLRNSLDLKATRFGCGQEQCGACMVLVDGVPAYSCTYAIADCAGKHITTAEVLVADAASQPLRDAFVAEQAGQCGYCLSGILMSASALLERCAAPTHAQIIEALEPHLCRCGAHGRIIRAVERAAAARLKDAA